MRWTVTQTLSDWQYRHGCYYRRGLYQPTAARVARDLRADADNVLAPGAQADAEALVSDCYVGVGYVPVEPGQKPTRGRVFELAGKRLNAMAMAEELWLRYFSDVHPLDPTGLPLRTYYWLHRVLCKDGRRAQPYTIRAEAWRHVARMRQVPVREAL